LILMSWR